jgi:hypothetical protein
VLGSVVVGTGDSIDGGAGVVGGTVGCAVHVRTGSVHGVTVPAGVRGTARVERDVVTGDVLIVLGAEGSGGSDSPLHAEIRSAATPATAPPATPTFRATCVPAIVTPSN